MIPKLNLLYSLAYTRPGTAAWDDLALAMETTNVLIDSGGYSNFTSELKGQETVVSFEDYVTSVRFLDGRAWAYVTLDDPARWDVTMEQTKRLYDMGFTPMPVFSPGMPFKLVPELVEMNDGRLCVGGCVGARVSYAHHRYQKIWELSKGQAKIHALGYSRLPGMFRLPIATVDSHSHGTGSSAGAIRRYDRKTGTMAAEKFDKPLSRECWLHLSRCGVTMAHVDLKKHRTTHLGIPSMVTINAFLNVHRHCVRLKKPAFFFAAGESWLDTITAVVATKEGDVFNYPESYAIRLRMKEVRAAKRSAFLDMVREILTTKTEQTGAPNE